MQGDVNSAPGGLGVVGSEIQERIKRRSWIRIQKCFPQSRLADFANGQVLPLVPRITEARFPVPRFEVIAKFSHLATQPHVEERIVVSEFFMSGTSIVNAAIKSPCSHGDWNSVNNQSRIRDGEGIKRIRDWHTDAEVAKAYVSAWRLEWIRRKRHRCQRDIQK